jgi:hypothetical protein
MMAVDVLDRHISVIARKQEARCRDLPARVAILAADAQLAHVPIKLEITDQDRRSAIANDDHAKVRNGKIHRVHVGQSMVDGFARVEIKGAETEAGLREQASPVAKDCKWGIETAEFDDRLRLPPLSSALLLTNDIGVTSLERDRSSAAAIELAAHAREGCSIVANPISAGPEILGPKRRYIACADECGRSAQGEKFAAMQLHSDGHWSELKKLPARKTFRQSSELTLHFGELPKRVHSGECSRQHSQSAILRMSISLGQHFTFQRLVVRHLPSEGPS